MRLLLILVRTYPGQTVVVLTALLLVALAEGISLTALIPFIGVIVSQQTGASEAPVQMMGVEKKIRAVLDFVGLSATPGVLMVVILLAIVAKCLLELWAQRRIGYTVARMTTDLRVSLFRAFLGARWQYFVRQPLGRLANAIGSEASRAAKAYLSVCTIASLAIQALLYLLLALFVAWEAAAGALFLGALLAWVLRRFIRRARRAGERQTKVSNALLSHLADSFQSVKAMKAMGREAVAERTFRRNADELRVAMEKQVLYRQLLRSLQEPILIMFIALGLYVAVVYWQASVGALIMIALLLAKLMRTLNKVQQEYQEMVMLESAHDLIVEREQEALAEREHGSGVLPPSLESGVEFREVVFRYAAVDVLRGLDLALPARKITAIVGPSGEGKTTIIDLLVGLLLPTSGDVLIDRASIREVDMRAWRSMIGYLPQDPVLLHESVKTNVALEDPTVGAADVERALELAGAAEFVSRFPEGVDTVVGERGGRLSGGQRQRVALARALVHGPKLLILDEPTSALDPEAEAAFCERLRFLRQHMTVVVVSHQPAVMRAADVVYRVQGGKAFAVGADEYELLSEADGAVPSET